MRFEAERHYIVTLLESLRSVSKLSPRGVSCGFAGHTIRLKFQFRMLAMKGHFFSEFAAELFAANENPHSFETNERHNSWRSLCVLQYATDGRDHLIKLREFRSELLASGGGQGVITCAAVVSVFFHSAFTHP